MVVPKDVNLWIKKNLFQAVPIAIAVMDKDFNVVYANRAFEEMFGSWENNKCYKVYKNREALCEDCRVTEALKDGLPRLNEEIGFNKEGIITRYIKHTVPIIEKDGSVSFLVEMSTDVTEITQARKEYQLLFEQVPCNILIIDKDFRIVRTNKRILEMFGNIEGQHCYKSLKGLDSKCKECTAQKTFSDGGIHTGISIVRNRDGESVHFQVTTLPIEMAGDKVNLIMETAVDITQTIELREKLTLADTFLESMIATSLDGIIAADDLGNVTIFNASARNIVNITDRKKVSMEELNYMLPDDFLKQVSAGPGHVYLPETEVQTIEGISVPVRLSGIQLKVGERSMGMAISIQDLREIKQLESEKLEAERLAAVGQTVAGLAHGAKNLVTSLKGGEYMLNSGMKSGNIERIQEGLEMLSRNTERISTFIQEFLSFSKGREIHAELCDPSKIAEEVVDMYSARAKELGIELLFEPKGKVEKASIDFEGMHECLTNLVGNAIDACRTSEDNKECHVRLRVYEETGMVIFEVTDDGCGMDYEVKKKVFTSFFTTKGLGGTGLGLLTTKKIVQEHGGRIDMESEIGKGTTLRIKLPRSRLPRTVDNSEYA